MYSIYVTQKKIPGTCIPTFYAIAIYTRWHVGILVCETRLRPDFPPPDRTVATKDTTEPIIYICTGIPIGVATIKSQACIVKIVSRRQRSLLLHIRKIKSISPKLSVPGIGLDNVNECRVSLPFPCSTSIVVTISKRKCSEFVCDMSQVAQEISPCTTVDLHVSIFVFHVNTFDTLFLCPTAYRSHFAFNTYR